MALAGSLAAEPLGLGRPALPEEVAAWDIDVRPDGLGLPEGSGDVATGEPLYTEKCAGCHGDFGEAVDRWPQLAGGGGSLSDADPVKTLGSYWPYLSSGYDYIHRAMPFTEARSRSADETYAILAYVLYLNDLVDEGFTLSRETFLDVEMPNAGGFFADDRDRVELCAFSQAPCAAGCKAGVTVTRHATVLDVTPEDAADAAAAPGAEVAAVPADEPGVPEPDPALVAAGAQVFKKCAACHKVGDGARNGVGPVLTGVVGAAAGAHEGCL